MKLTITCVVLLLVVCAQRASATTYHTVGDADGWGPDNNYAAWAKHKTFRRGDVLVFKYQEGYGVQEVRRSEMSKCDGNRPLYQGSDGNTAIPLKTLGAHFFICSEFQMCHDGMNMTVSVTK